MTETESPSIYRIFWETTIGTLALLPSFVFWTLKLWLRHLAALDTRITRAMRSESKYWWVWSRIGDGWAYAAVVLWLLRTGRVELAGHISACIVLAWGFSGLLKMVFRRRRPHDVLLARLDPKFRPSLWSFPSQHAACASALCIAWDPRGLMGLIVGCCAGLVYFSRIKTGSHFVSDVLAGIAIGVAAGLWG